MKVFTSVFRLIYGTRSSIVRANGMISVICAFWCSVWWSGLPDPSYLWVPASICCSAASR